MAFDEQAAACLEKWVLPAIVARFTASSLTPSPLPCAKVEGVTSLRLWTVYGCGTITVSCLSLKSTKRHTMAQS